jgi:hypothetical protein
MKPIKKFSTEMNQPKSILESLDSKALDELIKGMGFKDVHELKREKNLLAKLEALLKEVNPKQNISEDDAEEIEDDIKKKGEPKSLEDVTGEKEPETPVGKPEEIEEEEKSEDKEETEEESDEDEMEGSKDKVEVEVEDSAKDKDSSDKVEVEVEVEDEDEAEEESAQTPKATRKIMTFEDFVQEETKTVNKNVNYRDDDEEKEDYALPVADSKDNDIEVEETLSNTKSAVKSFSQFISEAMVDKGPELKDEEASVDGTVVPITGGDGSETAAGIAGDIMNMGKPEEKKDEEGEKLVTKDQKITEDPKTSKDEVETQGKVVVKESVNEAKEKSFTFNYNTDDDDVEYIQDLLLNAGVDAIAEPGIESDEMVIKAPNAVELRKAKKAIEKDGFEIKESVVTEAEIKSDDEFKEYAFAILQKAFGDDFDEAKAQEVVDGLTSKYSGDYGAMVGALQSTMGS